MYLGHKDVKSLHKNWEISKGSDMRSLETVETDGKIFKIRQEIRKLYSFYLEVTGLIIVWSNKS